MGVDVAKITLPSQVIDEYTKRWEIRVSCINERVPLRRQALLGRRGPGRNSIS